MRSVAGAGRRAVIAQPVMDYAIEAYNLRKVYRTRNGTQAAVDGLDLRVPVGGVHGFLGPNGSGKTTTIRMLLGLIAADSGHIRIFDHEIPLAIHEVINRVGAIVEQPKFFPAFSGQKNLQLLASAIGAPRRRVAAVLDDVGLAGRRRDKFRNYSLGMKQRLAIAATLLKDPDLLIFDEPTNGLDPAGIHEIRTMMRSLASRGKTVLVSSHVLSEVQQIADTVTIIGRGRLLAEAMSMTSWQQTASWRRESESRTICAPPKYSRHRASLSSGYPTGFSRSAWPIASSTLRSLPGCLPIRACMSLS